MGQKMKVFANLAQAVLFVVYVADELDARPSKRPLKEESCETEFVYSVSQFFRRLAESDDFLQVLEVFTIVSPNG